MKNRKLLLLSTSVLSCAFLNTATVSAGVSANVALTSDYRFRGISQNDTSFAIQGGFDYENDSGFHAGIWSSSVDFQVQTTDDASSEVDLYAGYGGTIGDTGFSYDVGFLHYLYPNADSGLSYDFTEINATLNYEFLSLYIAKTSDYFAGSGSADYINLSTEFELENDITVGGSIGYQHVEDNNAWGTPDWYEYKLFVGTSYEGFDFELAYIDTDLSTTECFGGSDWCDSTFTVTVSKSFE